MTKILTILLSIATGLAALFGTAAAEYSLCNKTSYVLSAAIGYEDGQRMSTRGWWRLRPGQCQVVLNEQVREGRYFVYAEAIAAHRGNQRTWSGETPLCVEESGFFTLRNQAACQTDPRRQRLFSTVEVSDADNGDWRTDFHEELDFSVVSAEAAGLQRLLSDVGYDVGAIDGAAGRRTQLALASFRRDNKIASGTPENEVVDSLIRIAMERESKLGFFMCNDTPSSVWGAVAEPVDEEGYRSRGWWRIDGESCVKVMKGELASDHYYVYGLLEGDDVDTPTIDSDREFCVSPVTFEIDGEADCDAEGFETASFKRIEIGDAKSWTFRFRPDVFAAN
ncbi:MAG: DUF1036 domain-containing protein [Pseudomonadota bacterium]